MKYNKLVRDKIPEIIKFKGETCVTHIANDEEYWNSLLSKLDEEFKEFSDDSSIEELADILEVIDAIVDYKKIDRNKLEEVKYSKKLNRGGFSQRIILDETN